MTRLRFGFSPCPNDTFQFYAMLHDKVDTHGLQFEPVIRDVEELNNLALEGSLELTKASYGALGKLTPGYWCLRAGGALGRGCGPLWVAREADGRSLDELGGLPIAHPGENTTAHLLLELRLGKRVEGAELVFHEIMDAVLAGRADSGVIIHEGRFTYRARGLRKVEDLGQWWEETTGAPIPLGNILLRRDFDAVAPDKMESILRSSLQYARENTEKVMEYVRGYAQELEESVMREHIDLYVNQYSVDLGEDGMRAVKSLLERQAAISRIERPGNDVFYQSNHKA